MREKGKEVGSLGGGVGTGKGTGKSMRIHLSKLPFTLGVKFPGPFFAGNCVEKPYCGYRSEGGGGGGSEEFHRKRGKIAEHRTFAGVDRRYFGVNGDSLLLIDVNARGSRLKRGQGILHLPLSKLPFSFSPKKSNSGDVVDLEGYFGGLSADPQKDCSHAT